MARTPKVAWHEKAGCYRSDVGETYTDANGKTRRKTKYFQGFAKSDRRGAQAALEAYVRARDDQYVPAGEFTLEKIAELYLERSERTAKPLTFLGHSKILSRFLDAGPPGRKYATIRAQDFTATDLERIVNAWAKAGRKPNYIARMVSSVQAMLNWAAAPVADREPERLIDANPVKGFSSDATRAPRSADRYAPEEEIAAFLEFVRARAKSVPGPLARRFELMTADLIDVAAMTGARPGELRVAEWADFEPSAEVVAGESWGRIRLDASRWKAGGKTGEFREVFLPPAAVELIERIRAHPDHHPRFIWTHKRGARSSSRGADVRAHGEPWSEESLPKKITALRRGAIAAGVELADTGTNRFTLYRLRHTAAARLLMAGVHVATVAKLLGTSPEMITRTYSSFLSKHLVEAASLGLGSRTPTSAPSVSADDSGRPNRP
jgi:integrase